MTKYHLSTPPPLDTIQIEHAVLSSSNVLPSTNIATTFKGVFPANRLPKLKNKTDPFAFIANTDIDSLPGQHWVSFYKAEGLEKNIEYMCSYGMSPSLSSPYHSQWLTEYQSSGRGRLVYNSSQLQSPYSSTCGYYCIAFVLCRVNGLPFSMFLDSFSTTDFGKNDSDVVDAIMRWSDLNIHHHSRMESTKRIQTSNIMEFVLSASVLPEIL